MLLLLLGPAAGGAGGGALLLQAPLRPYLGSVGSGSVLGLGGGSTQLAGLLKDHLLPLVEARGRGAARRGRLLEVVVVLQGVGEDEGPAGMGRADHC